VETSASTLLHRCRFARALNDLEKSGLIKVKSGGAVVTRQIFTWIDNSNNDDPDGN
jgi:predicted transcriptional regulator